MIKEIRKRPFVRPLFLWIAGTVCQHMLDVAAFSWLLLLMVAGLLAVSSTSRKEVLYTGRWAWGAVFACLLIFLSIQLTHWQERQERWPFPEGYLVRVKGVVADDLRAKPRSVQCVLRLDSVCYAGRVFPSNQSVCLYMMLDSAVHALLPGDRLSCTLRFQTSHRLARSVSATAYCPTGRWERLPGREHSLFFSALDVRRVLLGRMEALRLSQEAKASLAAIALGYRGELSRSVEQSFSVAGVAHILSVSGFHVAIVCWFLLMLLFFFPKNRVGRWGKYGLVMGLLWTFAYLSGLSVPTVRAALMLSLFLTGRVLRRTTDAYNTLAAAAFCMLVFHPLDLFDVGFQLSYLAVFSILYVQPRLQRLIKVRNPLLAAPWGWITVTLAAQVGTAPLCLYYFGQFPLMFLFTNLPLAVLATVLIPVAWGWLLLAPWLPVGNTGQVSVEWLTDHLLWVVHAFSAVPGASYPLRISLPVVLLGYASLFLLFLYGRLKRPRILLAGLFGLLIILLLMVIERIMRWNI